MSDPYEKKLDGWGRMAEKHWKEYRPKMYRELKKKGQLHKALYAAQELSGNLMVDLTQQGLAPDQAWELVREQWLLLPSEEDVPELGRNPAEWEPPPNPEEETM